MATVAEGGKTLPLSLAPMGFVDVTITTTANPGAGLEQTYSAIIETDGEGDSPREYPIAMQFVVADILKAESPSLQIHEADADAPANSSLVLFTYRDPRVIAMPTIRVLGSDRIKAEVRASTIQKDHDRKTLPRYVVGVRIEPASGDGGELIEGSIEIETPGEAKVTVPVSCSFRSDIRFQPSFVGAGGCVGEVVDRDIYQEFAGDAWKDITVVSKPEGCEVRVSRFDAGTNRIRLTLPVLAADQSGFLVLASSDRLKSVRVPIRYQPE